VSVGAQVIASEPICMRGSSVGRKHAAHPVQPRESARREMAGRDTYPGPIGAVDINASKTFSALEDFGFGH